MESSSPAREWSWPTRFAFRAFAIYFTLSSLLALLQLVPFLGGLVGELAADLERRFVVRVADACFGLAITTFPGGSGDTTYNYVQVAAYAALASFGAIVWSALDRRSRSYPRLAEALWIGMRFVLASAMLGYGLNKVFGLQFPAPGMTRLLQRYGDSSPMGVLWTFMGTSKPYVMFSGWMETIAGVLLVFRRTSLLGALVAAAVLANIVALNFCYDVPVKLYSSHLLLTACMIALPHTRRLWDVFVGNRAVPPVDLVGPWKSAWLRRSAFGIKIAWVAITLPLITWSNYRAQFEYGDAAPKGELDGTWEVLEFRRDGVEMPALTSDATRWRYFTIIDKPVWKMATVTHMLGPNERYRLVYLDAERRQVESAQAISIGLIEPTAPNSDADVAPTPNETLQLVREGDGRVRLRGALHGVEIDALCSRMRESEFLLVNRGFHWVNEYPFNR